MPRLIELLSCRHGLVVVDVIDLAEEAFGAILAWIRIVLPDRRRTGLLDPVVPSDQQGIHTDLICDYISGGGPPGPGQRTAAFLPTH